MATTKPRLLLAEDELNLGDVLKSYLEMSDFDVTLARDGEAAFTEFQKGEFDLCIFDVMMPKKDGFELAKDVRNTDKDIPIVFLTAKNLQEDVLNGFKEGGDDYIVKPFNSEELVYRIQSILKRSQQIRKKNQQREFTIGKFNFNYPLRILSFEDQEDKLSPKEAELLKMFAQHKNDVLPRSKALTEIWEEDNYFTARSMDVFITKLRKYLKRDENIEIVNIHGNGFQLLIKEEGEATEPA